MTRTPVISSNVKAIAYDPVRNVLEVEFIVAEGKPPSLYECRKAGPTINLRTIYERMLAPGASVGRIYNASLRNSPEVAIVRVAECDACGRSSEELFEINICPNCEAFAADRSA